MIQLENIHKAYGSDALLDCISLIIGKKERVALVGRNGAGKTTLFRLIIGQEEADGGKITLAKNYTLGHLSQHIHFTEKSVLAEACLGLADEEKEMTYKAESILFGLGFKKEDLEKPPTAFSGGFFLRLHLAKLLLSNPDCLLLDEPTNYLDILSIRWLGQFLRSWPGELVMISHDRQFLDSICTHTIGIHRKKLKRVEGPTEKLFEQIALEEEVHERTRQAIDKKRDHMQKFIDRFGAKNTKATQAQSRQKAINRLPSLDALCQIDDLRFSFQAAQTNSKIIMRVDEVSFGYTPSMPLIHNFELEVEKEARIAIIGPNGKGKSTLLKLLHGDLLSSSGQIVPISGLNIGYFGQSHIESLDPALTVEEAIKAANPALTTQEVRAIAGKMMFTQARSEKRIGVLSGGEKSRVVLGKLLASPCHLLLLDEPTNHLDIESMEAFMDALEEFEGACIVVSHSELLLDRLANQLVVFKNGSQEHFRGSYEEFLQKGGWSDEEEKAPVKRESSYKDEKRKRAELVTERAKALKPHQMRQDLLEARIIQLEEEVTCLNNKLLETSNFAEIGKSIKEKQKEIDTLFNELESVTNLVNTIKQNYPSLPHV